MSQKRPREENLTLFQEAMKNMAEFSKRHRKNGTTPEGKPAPGGRKKGKEASKTNDDDATVQNVEHIRANELNDRFGKCKNDSEKLNVMFQAVIESLVSRHDLQAQITQIGKKQEQVAEALVATGNEIKKVQLEARKRCLLIKGLPLHPNAGAGREGREQTRNVLDQFFKDLKIEKPPVLISFARFQLKKRPSRAPALRKNVFAPIIRIELQTDDDKAAIFNGIARFGKNKELKGISLQNDYPSFLLERKKELEAKAYLIRKKSRGSKKTRLVVRGVDLALQVDNEIVDDQLYKTEEEEKQTRQNPVSSGDSSSDEEA